MPTEPLIILIGIAIVVNLVIMGALIVTLVRRWRPEPPEASAAIGDARLARATSTPDTFSSTPDTLSSTPDTFSSTPGTFTNDLPDESQETIDTVTAADDARRFRSVLEDEPHASDQEAIAFFVSPPTALGPREQAPEVEFEPAGGPHLADFGDPGEMPAEQTVVWSEPVHPRRTETAPLPRVDDALDWDRRVRDETSRLTRYRRPVTVVLVELDGFERLVGRLGADAAERLIPAIADTLVRNGRATDHVSRLAANRFGVLMPETDEIQAINYAERIRAQCDRWLAAGSISTRIALGWACPTPGSDLPAAIRIAEERLQADRRRPGRSEVAS